MKKYSIIFRFMFVLISSLMADESEAKNVNEKFAFIKEIYSDSWALIIGINKYKYVQSLNYAAEDAMDVKKILVEKYGFKESNIKLILPKFFSK